MAPSRFIVINAIDSEPIFAPRNGSRYSPNIERYKYLQNIFCAQMTNVNIYAKSIDFQLLLARLGPEVVELLTDKPSRLSDATDFGTVSGGRGRGEVLFAFELLLRLINLISKGSSLLSFTKLFVVLPRCNTWRILNILY